MRIFKLLMQIMARYDFEKGNAPRFNNESYLNEYGQCYAIAAACDYFTGV